MKIQLKCEQCSKLFYRYVSEHSKSKESKHIFCSIECYAKSISNKIKYNCEYCNKTFYRSPSNIKCRNIKYCSKECHAKAKSLANGKFVKCSGCGKKIFRSNYYLDNLNNYYCSRDCMPKAPIVNCLICGKEFKGSQHHIDLGRGKYCSKKCAGIALRGENAPNWNPDKDEYTKVRGSFEYKEWRYAVYERDNYTCQKCGKEKDLVAHHIWSFAKYEDYRIDVHNGITFCKSCHELFHSEYGTRDFNPIDTFKFLHPNLNHKKLVQEKLNEFENYSTVSKI